MIRATAQHNRSRTRVAVVAALALIGASCSSETADDGGDAAVSQTIGSAGVVDASATTAAPSTTADPAPTTTASAVTTTTAASSTTAATTTTTAVEEPSLAWRSVELVDASRASGETLDIAGNVKFEGSDSRSIPTVILYPGTDGGGADAPVADTQPRPLAVYFKGIGGLNRPTDPLLVMLAEAGYVVAAPNIREMSDPVNYGPGYVEQPGDAQFVINALTDPADGSFDDLAAVIDPVRIGLVGHSIGAAGPFGLAYHDCCRDARVAAVVAFGPNPGFALGESAFEFADTPLLLVYGSNDDIAPVEFGTAILDLAQPPSHMLTIPGADHYQPVYGDGNGGEGDRAAMIAATVGVGFLDLHVAGTTTRDEFDDLTASLEPGTWRNAGA